ncbi:capsular biosynthesis protein [Sulfurovum sp. zt1-1]|uniref:protein-tyrosine-phosphatase n=1 Tax=Sulfurovum zhangzhouensis TaxID=3019067 RepID=A0ABT7QWQ4_9BACT|nr:CpsB/CapC family capsule biosynthesis tyrosine phosphatase [Sulfurovum zhangzhouensis]MDM5270969.1 capsular biosynthesis protein [Sulfurovum zhangzhouensis]
MIFSFFKKKKKHTEGVVRELCTDIHSHLIPGIDDGSKDIGESIILLRAMSELGYKKVITTPHIMSDGYKNTSQNILEGLKALRSAAKGENIDLEINAAAEYYLDDGFYNQLKDQEILSVGDYLLIETSYISKPLQFDEMIFDIQASGFKPMLAHPERYRYIKDLKREYKAMKDKGIYFQVNLNSFSGHYGKEAKRKADFLSKAGMIDFLGSDVHHMKQVETLSEVLNSEILSTIYSNNTILNDSL